MYRKACSLRFATNKFELELSIEYYSRYQILKDILKLSKIIFMRSNQHVFLVFFSIRPHSPQEKMEKIFLFTIYGIDFVLSINNNRICKNFWDEIADSAK